MFRSLTKNPTSFGLLALLLWSTASTSVCSIKDIPPLQVLMIVFFIISVLALVKTTLTRELKTLKIPLKTWIVVILGMGLQQILFIFAFKSSAPAEIDVIIYLWPMMAIGFSCLFFKEKIKSRQVVASLLGLSALLLLSFEKMSFSHFESGHLFALLCALAWSLYSVLMRKMPDVGMNVLGVSCCVSFFFTALLHISYEEFVWPTGVQWIVLFYYSLCISYGAYILWTFGVQRGNANYLTLCAYFKPVVSLLLLCSFGLATFSFKLGLAVLLVSAAGLISHPLISAFLEKSWLFCAREIESVVARPHQVRLAIASRLQGLLL